METYRTTDDHTGGEPFRIVVDGLPEIPGTTVADRRMAAMADPAIQRIRALLCSEPRGHADMYGGFITPPDDDGAAFGVLFWHKDGFSTACGHGTIALGVWAVDEGLVPRLEDGESEVVIDVPSGRVRARLRFEASRVAAVSFVNVPSWVHRRDVSVVTSQGSVTVDIAFGGAMYAVLPAAAVGLDVVPADVTSLIAAGREIRNQLNVDEAAEHPSDPRLSGVYGVIFTAPGDTGDPLHQRNVTVFSDGEVDRSPCGSGTAARVALLADSGDLVEGQSLLHESIVGSFFDARIAGRGVVPTQDGGRAAVVAEVTGAAYRTGRCEFVVDDADPMVPGFVLR